MTLNQVLQRIENLSKAHKQIRAFRKGLTTDFFTDQTSKYPAVLLQDNGGNISVGSHQTTLNYRMFFVDLVHVSEDSKLNEQDVQSDMVLIAQDLLAEMNSGFFDDWSVSSDNNLTLFVENENDLHAGCYIDISISIIFIQNICAVPTIPFTGSPIDTDMKVYDEQYTADGSEGNTLTLPVLTGKKILFISRNNDIVYPVSNLPSSTEYIWNGVSFTFGVNIIAGQRFLILYRNN